MRNSKNFSVVQISTAFAAAVLSLSVMAAERPAPATTRVVPQLSQSYTWYDGNREEKVWLNPQIVAEFNPTKKGATAAKAADAGAKTLYSRGAVRLWQMNTASDVAVRSMTTSNVSGK
jgi:hypothetical protein